MNHIFRVIFNHSLQCWQAVAEIGRRQHKTRSEKSATTTLSTPRLFKLLPLSAFVALSLQNAFAAPQGGQVSAGQATITQQGKVTDIHQSSQNAAINWQKFDVAPKETVNFHQPNKDAITLNRVTGKEESVIQGAINAKGNVFISNPNGVLIGNNAQINVGSLVATTQAIKDEDLMNGKLKFDGQAGGKVENNADIRVPKGGVIALIAPIVKNNGKLTAFEGNVLLASAEKFSITLPKDNFSYTLDRGTLQGLVDNKGAILTDGGRVVLTAKGISAVKKSVIKHSGVIEANTVRQQNGVIELLGDLDHSELQLSGTIKAEGKGKAPGGKVETSAAKLKISDKAKVSTKSEKGKTGKWTIDPKDFVVAKEGGDITGKQVSQFLASNDMELKSRDGKIQEGKGDVIINDEIAWDKNTLTLNAENDIKINQPLNGLGEAKLVLKYGQGSSDGGSADYYVNAQVNLPAGKNFSIQKGENGERKAFMVYHQMPEIVKNANGDWVSQFTEKYIAFGQDIDLSYTKNYLGFAGWDTRSKYISLVRVNIDGLGHNLDKLNLDTKNSSNVGLFTRVSGDIRNIGVTNINIFSSENGSIVGGLVGEVYSNSTLSHSYATGNVSASGDSSYVGGLVGEVRSNSTLSNSYATGRVEASGDDSEVGGLVGRVYSNSTLSNSYATGNVEASGYRSKVGGLVGIVSDDSTLGNSYATGNVETLGNVSSVGGLVGIVGGDSTLGNSYATGSVKASGDDSKVGGLVGTVGGGSTLGNSYATGNISASGNDSRVGGLVGTVGGSTLGNSYATGGVEASGRSSHVGGLVGSVSSNSTLSNSYATGNVEASGNSSLVGGLVGQVYSNSTLGNSYAAGRVGASGRYSRVGGLVGEVWSNSTLSNSYATGNVEASGEISYVGGLVGAVYFNSTLSNSYATGRVEASGERSYVGGLVGLVYSNSTLGNSYATGNVSASGEGSRVGGLVGQVSSNSTLGNSYATGNVEALGSYSQVGDFAGYASDDSILNALQKLTAPEIKKFVQDKWDLDNTWAFVEGADNPVLKTMQSNTTPNLENNGKLNWDAETWIMPEGAEHPVLRAFQTKATALPEQPDPAVTLAKNLTTKAEVFYNKWSKEIQADPSLASEKNPVILSTKAEALNAVNALPDSALKTELLQKLAVIGEVIPEVKPDTNVDEISAQEQLEKRFEEAGQLTQKAKNLYEIAAKQVASNPSLASDKNKVISEAKNAALAVVNSLPASQDKEKYLATLAAITLFEVKQPEPTKQEEPPKQEEPKQEIKPVEETKPTENVNTVNYVERANDLLDEAQRKLTSAEKSIANGTMKEVALIRIKESIENDLDEIAQLINNISDSKIKQNLSNKHREINNAKNKLALNVSNVEEPRQEIKPVEETKPTENVNTVNYVARAEEVLANAKQKLINAEKSIENGTMKEVALMRIKKRIEDDLDEFAQIIGNISDSKVKRELNNERIEINNAKNNLSLEVSNLEKPVENVTEEKQVVKPENNEKMINDYVFKEENSKVTLDSNEIIKSINISNSYDNQTLLDETLKFLDDVTSATSIGSFYIKILDSFGGTLRDLEHAGMKYAINILHGKENNTLGNNWLKMYDIPDKEIQGYKETYKLSENEVNTLLKITTDSTGYGVKFPTYNFIKNFSEIKNNDDISSLSRALGIVSSRTRLDLRDINFFSNSIDKGVNIAKAIDLVFNIKKIIKNTTDGVSRIKDSINNIFSSIDKKDIVKTSKSIADLVLKINDNRGNINEIKEYIYNNLELSNNVKKSLSDNITEIYSIHGASQERNKILNDFIIGITEVNKEVQKAEQERLLKSFLESKADPVDKLTLIAQSLLIEQAQQKPDLKEKLSTQKIWVVKENKGKFTLVKE